MENKFYLPFVTQESIDLIYAMQEQIQKYHQYLNYPNTVIDGVYGNFIGVIWNGGLSVGDDDFNSLEKIEQCLHDLNKNNLTCKLTFTNQVLTEEHLNDKYCNDILDLVANTNNEITIYSKLLEDYILNKYPKILLTSSVTKGYDLLTLQEAVNSNKYDSIVCYPRQNILNYVKTLNEENQNKIEILLNSGCAYCKMFHQHFRVESLNSLHQQVLFSHKCHHSNPNYSFIKDLENQPVEERLVYDINEYQKSNVHKYKITGRNLRLSVLIRVYCYTFFPKEIAEQAIEDINILFNIKN